MLRARLVNDTPAARRVRVELVPRARVVHLLSGTSLLLIGNAIRTAGPDPGGGKSIVLHALETRRLSRRASLWRAHVNYAIHVAGRRRKIDDNRAREAR